MLYRIEIYDGRWRGLYCVASEFSNYSDYVAKLYAELDDISNYPCTENVPSQHFFKQNIHLKEYQMIARKIAEHIGTRARTLVVEKDEVKGMILYEDKFQVQIKLMKDVEALA